MMDDLSLGAVRWREPYWAYSSRGESCQEIIMAEEVVVGIGIMEAVDCGEYTAESENNTDDSHMTFNHLLSVCYCIFYCIFNLVSISSSLCNLLHLQIYLILSSERTLLHILRRRPEKEIANGQRVDLVVE